MKIRERLLNQSVRGRKADFIFDNPSLKLAAFFGEAARAGLLREIIFERQIEKVGIKGFPVALVTTSSVLKIWLNEEAA